MPNLVWGSSSQSGVLSRNATSPKRERQVEVAVVIVGPKVIDLDVAIEGDPGPTDSGFQAESMQEPLIVAVGLCSPVVGTSDHAGI
jgi:hypothetical protein